MARSPEIDRAEILRLRRELDERKEIYDVLLKRYHDLDAHCRDLRFKLGEASDTITTLRRREEILTQRLEARRQ